jgi:hypothetical protein
MRTLIALPFSLARSALAAHARGCRGVFGAVKCTESFDFTSVLLSFRKSNIFFRRLNKGG